MLPLIPTPIPTRRDNNTPEFISSGAWRSYLQGDETLVPVPLPSAWYGRDSLSWSAMARHEFVMPEGYFLGPNTEGIGRMGPARDSWFSYFVTKTLRPGSPRSSTRPSGRPSWPRCGAGGAGCW